MTFNDVYLHAFIGKLASQLVVYYLAFLSTNPNVVSENIPFSTSALLILLMLAFFCKKSAFYFAKTVPSLKPTQQTFALLKTFLSSEDVLIKTNIFALVIRLQDVLIKTNIFALAIRLQGVFKTSCKSVFRTSSRRLKKFWRCLQDVLQRRLHDVLKTYHQVKLFAQLKDLPRSHF